MLILHHPAIALKDRAGFHGECPGRDVAGDYGGWTQLNPLMGNHVSVDPAADYHDSNVDVAIYLGRSVNDMAQQLSRFQETIKATERLRLLGQVSGGLAHQLRNGIAGAKLALQLHGREHAGEEVPESMQVALRQLALMENFLKRFFDLGKAMQVRPESIDLAILAEETASLLRPQCAHANIDLKVISSGAATT